MKKDLLLLHGALGARAQFEPFLPLLEEKFTIHALDFEGHGQHFSERAFSIENFAETLQNYLDEQSLKGANIFGYSMGGYVALYLAAVKPEYVDRIFTLGTKLLWTPEIAQKEVKLLDAGKILEKVPAYARTLEERHSGSDWISVLGRTRDMMISLGDAPVLTDELLGRPAQRIRIGLGDRDTMVSFEESLAAYRTLRNAEFQVLPDTPHPLEKVSVSRLCSAIQEFFA